MLARHHPDQEAIRRGAPGGLIFKSICGSEGLKKVRCGTGDAHDEARGLWGGVQPHRRGNCLYFETGQGLRSVARTLQLPTVTMEARNCEDCRRYDPFW
ncbi:ethanolamine ammonia-lyase subunit EutB [Salmonella enterica subsp. enterica]|nr:ethanolamine ammonia-lyase subunit EutB [Salmonella enterica subsp. enterica]